MSKSVSYCPLAASLFKNQLTTIFLLLDTKILPKKQANKFVLSAFHGKKNSYVCFFGESTACHNCFRIYLTFSIQSPNTGKSVTKSRVHCTSM